jgi:hypothetical protein
MQRRGLGVDVLSSSVGRRDLALVLDGGAPTPPALRGLAPALGLHAADLFVIAGLAVPDDLAPGRGRTAGWLPSVVSAAIDEPDVLLELRDFARSLRIQAPDPLPAPPVRQRYPPGFGGILVRLLHNRNLDWLPSAKVLYHLAGIGPLAAATIGMVGLDKKALTPELVAGFATVTGIPVGDLAALVGTDPPDVSWTAHPAASEAAGLIWDCRSLTDDQLRQLRERALAVQERRGSAPGGR